jgi:hypothetical protein
MVLWFLIWLVISIRYIQYEVQDYPADIYVRKLECKMTVNCSAAGVRS